MRTPFHHDTLDIPFGSWHQQWWRTWMGRLSGTVLVASCLLLSGAARADGCGPSPGGPPTSCGASSPASLGASGGPGAGAGNPINVITGNKYQREEDMPALPGVLGLEIVRHYNSAYIKPNSPNGPMGREWKLSYETELFDKFGRIQILQADGTRIIFDRDPNHPNLCSNRLPANGRVTLTQRADGMTDYIWRWPDGRRLNFNRWGKLVSIVAPSGEAVSLQYDPGNALAAVTDPQGRSLHLGYLDRATARAGDRFRGVQYIDSPVGRYTYEYGSAVPKGSILFDTRILWANLVRVRLPTTYEPERKAHPLTDRGTTTSAVSRLYHHEDPRFPWLLTGISIETIGADGKRTTARYATYGYDANGLANLSTHAEHVDQVTLAMGEGGRTVLTNSLGQQTVYRHAFIGGERRLLEVHGAGCATCGETNVRYGYDQLGQLVETTRLTENGEPFSATRRALDKLGRVVTVSTVDYRNGKPEPAQWRARMEYQGDGSAPVLIARPSVVPGKELQTRIAYNLVGQPLSVTETGWIPTYDGKQAAGQITRTTTYQYATINGRSLLTRIDGPLPNGKTNSPLDSDVTVLEYDHRSNEEVANKTVAKPGKLEQYDEHEKRDGLLTRIIAPGNIVTEVLARDEALRPARLRMADGDLVQLATVHNNWRGAPDDIELTAGAMRRHLHYDYDAAGHIQAVTRPGELRSAFEYDQAGRVSRVILPDGSGIAIGHDMEDRTASVARFDDMAPSSSVLSTTRFDYDRQADKPGKLTGMADSLGLLNSYRYNDIGQVIAIANALGTRAAFEYDADGRLASRTDAAGSPDAATLRLIYDNAGQATRISAPNNVTTLRRFDDFGRKVFEADPDRGVTLFQYDAAGRPLVRIDETQSATRYSYDHAGRLLAVGKDKVANLLQYRYRGSRLVNMVGTPDGKPEHATEKVDYQYDALGQLIRESRWLAGPEPTGAVRASTTGLLFVTSNEYDEAGRLVHQILPDGHSLRYRFTPGSGKAPEAEPHHRSGQLEAILFDDHIVVADIEHTLAGGLTGYTLGNGAHQQIQLDQRRRIAQLHTLSNATGAHAAWWHRVTAWFSASPYDGTSPLYRQANRYDEAGRLVRIERQLPAPDGRTPPMTRSENYGYDRMDRLTGVVPSDGAHTYFRYDQAGNRIAESGTPTQTAIPTALAGGADSRGFSYAQGSNWLIAAMQPAGSGTAAPSLRGAWLYHPTGLPLAQLQWLANGNAAHRRTVYNSDKRPVAVYDNDQLVARYHYNSFGERVAKTVYPARPVLTPVALRAGSAQGETTYTLYRDQRLAAEADGRGRITAHYVYLYGKPVAKIEMTEDTSVLHRLLTKVMVRSEDSAHDSVAQIYAIVTDHLGTPQEVLDERQRPVWQAVTAAFGQARVVYAAAGANGKPFQMNLRLPGQVYDAEAGLHYNYLRDYDPALGRYLAPDPLGLGGGTNPYAYVSNNPLTNIDPLGLYQIDVHYYMTFFLAITAGVDKDTARLIALATQYIDENPVTEPMLPNGLHPGSLRVNQPALERYHFVEDGYDTPRTTAESAYHILVGGDLQSYIDRRVINPGSPQLQRLLDASNFAKTDPNANCYSRPQLFGEYLHAFEDTFAHRDWDNNPYTATTFGLGTGHLTGGENPDFTYNHRSKTIVGTGAWDNNESRTLEMEKEVFAKLKAFSNPTNHQETSVDTIAYTLKTFNAMHADFSAGNLRPKIAILNDALKYLGYIGINITYETGSDAYSRKVAEKNRGDSLNGLNPADYIGTILPRGTAPLPEKK